MLGRRESFLLGWIPSWQVRFREGMPKDLPFFVGWCHVFFVPKNLAPPKTKRPTTWCQHVFLKIWKIQIWTGGYLKKRSTFLTNILIWKTWNQRKVGRRHFTRNINNPRNERTPNISKSQTENETAWVRVLWLCYHFITLSQYFSWFANCKWSKH